MLRVLIVDDMALFRKVLTDVVSEIPDVVVSGTAGTGESALALLRVSPVDLVLLDIEMPGIGGIETLKRIKKDFPDTEVVMISAFNERGSASTIEALNSGALEFVPKPTEATPELNKARFVRDFKPIFRIVSVRKMRMAVSETAVPAPTPRAPRPENFRVGGSFTVLALGISTGGPNALAKVIPALPGNFPLPVVVVQHMPAMFTQALAKSLNSQSALEVKEAATGDVLRPGLVLIAPGGRHMIVRGGGVVEIVDTPPVNSCRPAVDVLYNSLSENYRNSRVLSLIMTGMGSDGLNGLRELKKNSCYSLTQSERTCVVYGMPQAVDLAGLSDESIDLESLPQRLVELARHGR